MMNEAASIFYLLVDKLRRSRKRQLNYTAKYADQYVTKIFKDVSLLRQAFYQDWHFAEYPSISLMERTTFGVLTLAMSVLPLMSTVSF